ncbi:MAG TPA: WYL domain-containing protein, partial [Euzebyales bacterium]|nr:WYL domain-containing protein [Euzebyales bacterium]
VDEVEQRRARTSATVLVSARLVQFLQSQFGRHGRRIGEVADGVVRVEVAAPTPRSIAEQLAGWGTLLEVEGPEEVRTELGRIGTELVERSGAPA